MPRSRHKSQQRPSSTSVAASPGSPEIRPSRVRMRQTVTFSGPLPPPEILQGYDDVLPGAAERIIAMAERQAAHRQDLERRVIRANITTARLGIAAGLIITLAVVWFAYQLLMAGHTVAGFAAIIVALGSLVGVFIVGQRSQRNERIEKTRIMTGQVMRR